MINVAVVGCGYWGPNLVRNFSMHKDARVRYICDVDKKKLDALHALYPGTTPVTDYDEMLRDKNLAAVVIATPVHTHHALTKQALFAGKHVLVEKPLCSSIRDARDLLNTAKKHKRILMVDHTFIFNTAVQKIKQIIESGELGKLCYFDSVRTNLGLFQQNTNVLWDLATHDLSIVDFIFDTKPMEISAIGASHITKNLENTVYVTIRYKGNMLAHLHVNWLAPVKIRTTLIAGLKKMIVYDDMEPIEKIKVYDRGIDYHPDNDGINLSKYQYRVGDMYSPRLDDVEALSNMSRHFLWCIKNGKQPRTDGKAGVRIVTMLEKAAESIRKNGEFIRL